MTPLLHVPRSKGDCSLSLSANEWQGQQRYAAYCPQFISSAWTSPHIGKSDVHSRSTRRRLMAAPQASISPRSPRAISIINRALLIRYGDPTLGSFIVMTPSILMGTSVCHPLLAPIVVCEWSRSQSSYRSRDAIGSCILTKRLQYRASCRNSPRMLRVVP